MTPSEIAVARGWLLFGWISGMLAGVGAAKIRSLVLSGEAWWTWSLFALAGVAGLCLALHKQKQVGEMDREDVEDDPLYLAELGENLRFYADARFKRLTLMVAWLTLVGGGLLLSMHQFDGSNNGLGANQGQIWPDQNAGPVLVECALLFTAVMWLLEIRAYGYWCAQRRRAKRLWPQAEAPLQWVTASNVLFVFYAVVFAISLRAAHAFDINEVVFWLFAAAGLFILGFGIVSYHKAR